jgi:hypothetical protein
MGTDCIVDTVYVLCGFIPMPTKGKVFVGATEYSLTGTVMENCTCSIPMSNPKRSLID